MTEGKKTHGDFGWRDLLADLDSAREFYTDVIGWSTVDMPMGKGSYIVFKRGDRPVAGLKNAADAEPGAPAGWTSDVTVDDVDECASRAISVGGKVLVARTDVPTVERMEIVEDSAGGVLGLIAYAAPDDLQV